MGMDTLVFEDVDFNFGVIFGFLTKNGGGGCGDENGVFGCYSIWVWI